jgi:hypothetical protein
MPYDPFVIVVAFNSRNIGPALINIDFYWLRVAADSFVEKPQYSLAVSPSR